MFVKVLNRRGEYTEATLRIAPEGGKKICMTQPLNVPEKSFFDMEDLGSCNNQFVSQVDTLACMYLSPKSRILCTARRRQNSQQGRHHRRQRRLHHHVDPHWVQPPGPKPSTPRPHAPCICTRESEVHHPISCPLQGFDVHPRVRRPRRGHSGDVRVPQVLLLILHMNVVTACATCASLKGAVFNK